MSDALTATDALLTNDVLTEAAEVAPDTLRYAPLSKRAPELLWVQPPEMPTDALVGGD